MTRLQLKRHYRLLLLLALVAGLLVAGAGDQPIVAYSFQDTAGPAAGYGDALAVLVQYVAGGSQALETVPAAGTEFTP